MTKVAIVPEPAENGDVAYRAISGSKQSVGKTVGQALDALAAVLPQENSGTLVVVQNFRPDRFFTERQQKRLTELMARWRVARNSGTNLPPAEQSELNAEVDAASERAAAMLRERV
jgi:hypothetical protein